MANAWETTPGQFSLDVAAKTDYRRFLKVNSSGLAEYATSASDPIVGVSYTDAPSAGTPISITACGIAMVEAGATIAAGTFVTAGSDGKAVTAESKATAAGIALTGAGAGNLISVLL